MNISCDIIRDVLPLYAEDMVSNATRDMVDEHLCGCDACTQELDALKKPAAVPLEVEVKSLKRIGESIRRRKMVMALAAVMTVLTILTSVVEFLMTPIYLTADQAVEGVELRDDGALAIDFASGIVGHYGVGDGDNQGHLCHTTRYDWYIGKQKDKELENLSQEQLENYIIELYELDELTQHDWDRFHNIDVSYGTWQNKDGSMEPYFAHRPPEGEGEIIKWEKDYNHWYLNVSDGTAETLLWDAGNPAPTEPMGFGVSYTFAVIFYGSLALTVLLGICAQVNKNQRKKAWFTRFAIVFGGIAFSTLLVTGGCFISINSDYKWHGYTAVEAVFVVLTTLLWYQHAMYGKQDKGL